MYNFLLGIQYISILFLLIEATYIFKKMRTPLHNYLFFNCVATLINNTGYLMEMLSETESEYFMGVKMSYLGRVWISYSLFIFMLALCKYKFNKTALHVLAVFHAMTFLLVLTSEWHPLYYKSMKYVEEGVFPIIQFQSGIWHRIYDLVTLFYIVYGLYKMVMAVKREQNAYAKRQLLYVFIGILFESACFIINLFNLTGNYDTTVMGYAIGTIFMYIAIFKYGLLDTSQLAKEYVLDGVSEAIIAVNNQKEIEYYNKPAEQLIANIEKPENPDNAEIADKKYNEDNTENIENAKNMIIDLIESAIDKVEPIKVGNRIYAPERKELFDAHAEKGKVFVLVDETDHFKYMEELKEQKEIAEAANQSKSTFLSIVSHEIRTPMNAVVGMTDILLRDELTEKQRKYLTNIKNSGAALVMIINDILDLSKIEAGKMEIVEDEYALRELVSDVEMIIENRIGGKPIHLLINIDDKIPNSLIGDGLRIRQIIINLMNNAVKFTESGYIQLLIQIEEERDESYLLRFAVKDSGQGIKEEDLVKLGQAFSQVDTKKNHSKEGTGLGLSISKDFITLMGGELKVDSVYGKGTEFYFFIEQKKSNSVNDNKDSVKCSWKSTEFTIPNARILIVDDTKINRLIAEEIISPLKATTDTAESGQVALNKIKENKYDIIFMDYMMPLMDGVETTDKIRKMKGDYFKQVPIIALTGDTSERTQDMFKAAGINDFLEKPIVYEQIKNKIVKWLPEELIQTI